MEERIEAPLSPGTVALLVAEATDPLVQERWKQALEDDRPEVRAAAARVINVSNTVELVPALQNALVRESDREAAGEEIQALAALAPLGSETLLLQTAERLGAADLVSCALAAVRGLAALRHLPALRTSGLSQSGLHAFLRIAARGHALSLGPQVAAALREHDAVLWRAILAVSGEATTPLSPGMVGVALRSENVDMVRETILHLLLESVSGWRLPPEIPLELLIETTEKDDVEMKFMRELLRRHTGREPLEDAAWIEARRGETPTQLPPYDLDLLSLLTTSELEALSKQTTGDPKALGEIFKNKELHAGPKAATYGEPKEFRRTASGYPHRFFEDVLSQSGCRAATGQIGGGHVRYGADGRPRHVTPYVLTAPAECSEAVETLLQTALPPDGYLGRADLQVILYVLLNPETLACVKNVTVSDTAHPKRTVGSSFPESITFPKKIHGVDPVYPESALKEHVHGVVVLDALVTAAGCVSALELQRIVDPRLDIAALLAVSTWMYEPGLRGGEPSEFIMTVSVNFDIRQRSIDPEGFRLEAGELR